MTGGGSLHGVLPVLKHPGPTSHDVVARVRRLLGLRRVGHTGTLDPGAAGVLVVLVGPATRLARWLQEEDKTYVAEMRLGVATDTQDAFGRAVRREPDCRVSRRQIEEALARFVGAQRQTPPMTSAVRLRGRRLYELAQAGQEVSRPPRPVVVDELRLLHVAPGPSAANAPADGDDPSGAEATFGFGARARMRVVCSKGTYVRTLCHDVGAALGCGAHMSFLLRTRVGDIGLADARTLDELEREAASGPVPLLPPDAALGHVPAARLTAAAARRVRHGGAVGPEDFVGSPTAIPSPGGRKRPAADMLRLYDPEGRLTALAEAKAEGSDRWRPRLVFPDE